jgi:beta-galactosidase
MYIRTPAEAILCTKGTTSPEHSKMLLQSRRLTACGLLLCNILIVLQTHFANAHAFGEPHYDSGREKTSLNIGWQFLRSENNTDGIIYDHRNDTPATAVVLKPWILPSANDFINGTANKHQLPTDKPFSDIPYIKRSFNDSAWDSITLPYDWAIKGPFYTDVVAKIGGPMGRLPIFGVGWYRRKLESIPSDQGKSIYLEIEGAQSYAMVWLNEQLVGGWPYGYNSFRLDLTPYIKVGKDNILAIRLDNPVASSRFYPGGGIYRNVWLTKVSAVQVSQYGTFITSKDVSTTSATLDLAVQVESKATTDWKVTVDTAIHVLDLTNGHALDKVAEFPRETMNLKAGQKENVTNSITLKNPRHWGPPPAQTPNLYVAVTRISHRNRVVDTYHTTFGIRSITYDANKGLLVNGKHTYIQGVNQHHDLGALGAAFNIRAAERQLEVLKDAGCNAIRMSHNPPAPALLDLADRMGFLVIDEIFDMWERNKTVNDFHLIFSDWHEPDLRAFIRRDRNHPSIMSW